MELKEEKEGLYTVKEYKDINEDTIVIFVTAHDEFGREGYKVNALRYVYKLNLEHELKEALREAYKILARKEAMNIKILGAGNRDIYFKDIVYIETEKRKLNIHMKDTVVQTDLNITLLEKVMENKGFICPHKSYLANLNYVKFVCNKEVILRGGRWQYRCCGNK